jgi:hypothetical protein
MFLGIHADRRTNIVSVLTIIHDVFFFNLLQLALANCLGLM